MMSALGAEVVLVDQAPGSTPGKVSGEDLELVEQETQRIVKDRNAFLADQFHLTGSTRAHYLRTGQEILQQTGGSIGAFCDFLGTGSSFAGCAGAFKEHDPSIQCFVVEPAGAAILAGQSVTNPNHRIQGGGYCMAELSFLNQEHIDGYIQVSDDEAIRMARRLAREEGIFAGFSSGANVLAAVKLLKTSCQGKTLAVLLPDSGLKYLSTDLWL
jgi:cysteine synthase A